MQHADAERRELRRELASSREQSAALAAVLAKASEQISTMEVTAARARTACLCCPGDPATAGRSQRQSPRYLSLAAMAHLYYYASDGLYGR